MEVCYAYENLPGYDSGRGLCAYLGVSLCQNVINGAEGSSPGFMVAGGFFIVLGVAFVINGILAAT